MQTKRKAGLLIVFLLITVAMAVAFFPSVNSNVAEGLSSITAIDESSLDGATQTIFDSISYARSIHILAMLCWWASASSWCSSGAMSLLPSLPPSWP